MKIRNAIKAMNEASAKMARIKSKNEYKDVKVTYKK